MVKNCLKTYSISLVIEEMQIKAMARYGYALMRTDNVKRLTVPHGGENVEAPELSHAADRNEKCGAAPFRPPPAAGYSVPLPPALALTMAPWSR